MVRSGAQYRAVADAGRTRAAEGILVANFLLLKSDGSISGFAKNGDAIGFFDHIDHDWLLKMLEEL